MTTAAFRHVIHGLLAGLVLAGAADAQVLWSDRGDGDVVSVEVFKPRLRDGSQPFLASASFLGARKQLPNRQLAVVVDLPITHAEVYRYQLAYPDSGGPPLVSYSRTVETGISNPYLGIEIPGTWTHELGVRLDLAGRGDAGDIGSTTEVERIAAFAYRSNTVQYALSRRAPPTPGVHGSGRLGLLVLVGNGSAFAMTHRLMLEADRTPFRFAAGLVGFISVDPRDDRSLDERTVNQIEGIVRASWGAWRPALHIRWWADGNLRDVVPLVVGLRLEWRPR